MNRALSNEALLIGKVMAHREAEAKGLEKRFHARELFYEVLSNLSLDE
ncbi:MAG: hypothetical protein AB7E31_15600 [Desulfitobacterium sp.]